jgi:hypothetical protein
LIRSAVDIALRQLLCHEVSLTCAAVSTQLSGLSSTRVVTQVTGSPRKQAVNQQTAMSDQLSDHAIV